MNLIRVVIAVTMIQFVARTCKLCFNWRISSTKLTLFCKVSNFYLPAIIKDPRGTDLGHCLPLANNINCSAKYKNVTITINSTTNELIFTLHGVINKQVNGNWTCTHGTNVDIAHVEVNVFTFQETTNTNKEHRHALLGKQCIDKNVLSYVLSFIVAATIICLMMRFLPKNHIVDDWITKCTSQKNICRNRRICQQTHLSIATLKKCCFAVIAVLFFIFPVLIGYLDDEHCGLYWISIVIGIMIGIIFCLLFINVTKIPSHGNTTTNGDNIEPPINSGNRTSNGDDEDQSLNSGIRTSIGDDEGQPLNSGQVQLEDAEPQV